MNINRICIYISKRINSEIKKAPILNVKLFNNYFQFFRHGSRTPEVQDLYPNDPYDLDTFQPMGLGQLTNVSKSLGPPHLPVSAKCLFHRPLDR